MTTNDKQIALANQAYNRGLIDRNLAESIRNSKFSGDMCEVLFSLICGEVSDVRQTVTFIARMVKNIK